MCLAIPSRITAISGPMATIDVDGVRREVSLMLLGRCCSRGLCDCTRWICYSETGRRSRKRISGIAARGNGAGGCRPKKTVTNQNRRDSSESCQ